MNTIKLPKKIKQALQTDGVKEYDYFKVVTDNLVLVNTDKGTYCYTNDTLYRKNGGRKSDWLKCDDNTLHKDIF